MAEPVTSTDCLREGFAARLEGGTWKRDRMCESAEILMRHEALDRAVQKVLSVDFYINSRGAVIPSRLMAERAGITVKE